VGTHSRREHDLASAGARSWWRRLLPAALGTAALAIVIAAVVPASAAVLSGSPVPVAGVNAFGIGVGQFGSPGGLVLDGNGDLFAVDQSKNRVQEYLFNTITSSYAKAGTTVAGGGGTGSGATQLNLAGAVYESSQVALDAKGDLFIADTGNNRVQEYAFNSTTGTYAAAGTTVAGGAGQGSGATQLSSPGGVPSPVRK